MNASFALFKNDYKKAENHPDYKGKGTLEDGTEFDAAGWIKQDKNGNSFLSCKISPKRTDSTQKTAGTQSPAEKVISNTRPLEADTDENDLPF